MRFFAHKMVVLFQNSAVYGEIQFCQKYLKVHGKSHRNPSVVGHCATNTPQ